MAGRFLGLDVGERRIGIAVSDPDGRFALPLRSVDGRQLAQAVQEIGGIARDQEAEAAVVGLPLSLSGDASAQTEKTEEFAQHLADQLGITVHLWDERLSTQEAMRRVSDSGPQHSRNRKTKSQDVDVDALAASIILQAFLDRRRFAEGSDASGHDR